MKRPSETDPRYQRDLERGLNYEDWVTDILWKMGIPLSATKSKSNLTRGENRAGFEIKFDDRFAQTRNLFIETDECSVAGLKLKPAGIYAPDDHWIYVIGNYTEVFFFARTWLLGAHISGRFLATSIPTAKGFLLPEKAAVQYAAQIVDVDKDGNPKRRKLKTSMFNALSESGAIKYAHLKNLQAWQATDEDVAALMMRPFAAPRSPADRPKWVTRVRELMAESPLRDLPSCGIQARMELSGESRRRAEAAE